MSEREKALKHGGGSHDQSSHGNWARGGGGGGNAKVGSIVHGAKPLNSSGFSIRKSRGRAKWEGGKAWRTFMTPKSRKASAMLGNSVDRSVQKVHILGQISRKVKDSGMQAKKTTYGLEIRSGGKRIGDVEISADLAGISVEYHTRGKS